VRCARPTRARRTPLTRVASYQTIRISKDTPTSISARSSGTCLKLPLPLFLLHTPHRTRIVPDRWKQRDIHEKREVRKHKIVHLRAQIDCNNVLLPRITQIAGKLAVEQSPTAYFSGLVERLEKEPSRDCPPGNNPDELEQTYDGMLLSLLSKVSQEVKEKVKEGDGVPESEKNEKIRALLKEKMESHVKQLGETIEKDKKELESEIKEQKKHITSEDLHEGFESKVCGWSLWHGVRF
jgi:hypothetical protein